MTGAATAKAGQFQGSGLGGLAARRLSPSTPPFPMSRHAGSLQLHCLRRRPVAVDARDSWAPERMTLFTRWELRPPRRGHGCPPLGLPQASVPSSPAHPTTAMFVGAPIPNRFGAMPASQAPNLGPDIKTHPAEVDPAALLGMRVPILCATPGETRTPSDMAWSATAGAPAPSPGDARPRANSFQYVGAPASIASRLPPGISGASAWPPRLLFSAR